LINLLPGAKHPMDYIMTWWDLIYYFCEYVEERDLLMRGKIEN